jgi:CheY-like chemotaxis protein
VAAKWPRGFGVVDMPSAVAGAGHRLLIVDDNEDAAMLLADSLRALGHLVEVAHDGPSALTVMAAFKPVVALLDLGLPVMDGFELGERLRADPNFQGIVLIAVTGYAQDPRSTASRGRGLRCARCKTDRCPRIGQADPRTCE